MAYIGNIPAEKFTSVDIQNFTVSATANYTLDRPVANENEIELFINNVRQHPGSGKAYTASGTALTLSEATAGTDTMYCVYQGKARQTVTPATSSVTNAMLAGSIDLTSKVTGALPQANIADQAINEPKTQISNAPTNGYMLTAQSGNTGGLTWAEAPSGTHTLLEAINISTAVSHIDTSAFISSTYKTYLIIGRMFRPATNAVNIRMRGIEVGGSLMNSANYNYQQLYSHDSGVGRNYHSSATYLQMGDTISSSVDNGASNFALYFNCDRATGSDAAMTYYWQGGGASGGDAVYFAGGGWYDGVISNDPPEKLRFYFDSGDIHSGKITIYGITGAL